nr:hypothetical protein [Tsukamurella sp. PLM1]
MTGHASVMPTVIVAAFTFVFGGFFGSTGSIVALPDTLTKLS